MNNIAYISKFDFIEFAQSNIKSISLIYGMSEIILKLRYEIREFSKLKYCFYERMRDHGTEASNDDWLRCSGSSTS